MQAMMIDIMQLAPVQPGSKATGQDLVNDSFAQLLAQTLGVSTENAGLNSASLLSEELLAQLARELEARQALPDVLPEEALPFAALTGQMFRATETPVAQPDVAQTSVAQPDVAQTPTALQQTVLLSDPKEFLGATTENSGKVSREMMGANWRQGAQEMFRGAEVSPQAAPVVKQPVAEMAAPVLRDPSSRTEDSDPFAARFAALLGTRGLLDGSDKDKVLRFEMAAVAAKTGETALNLQDLAGRQGQAEQGFLQQRAAGGEALLSRTPRGAEETAVFSLEGARPVPAQPETGAGPTLRLPSGAFVPESHLLHQVVERLTLRHQGDRSQMTLRLHPEELGELRMELVMEKGVLKAQIQAQNPQVQEVLERNLFRLRDALEQQGLTLEQFDVNQGARQQGESSEQFARRQPMMQEVQHRAPAMPVVDEAQNVRAMSAIRPGGVNLRI